MYDQYWCEVVPEDMIRVLQEVWKFLKREKQYSKQNFRKLENRPKLLYAAVDVNYTAVQKDTHEKNNTLNICRECMYIF